MATSGEDPDPVSPERGDAASGAEARLRARRVLAAFAEGCSACGACLEVCPSLAAAGGSPDEIARALLAGGRPAAELLDGVERCHLCGLCGQACPLDLDPAQLMGAARQWLADGGAIDPAAHRLLRVDGDGDFFSLYRSAFGIDYADLERPGRDAFFPGCSLGAFGPELVRAAHGWLLGQGLDVGLVGQCCGLPLTFLGLGGESEAMLASLQERLAAAGTVRLITACPNCTYRLRDRLDGIEVVPLYRLLRDAGVRIPGCEPVTVHDSCQDRFTGEFGLLVRQLLGGHPVVEMPHHGAQSICCGTGGCIAEPDPDRPDHWAAMRLAEFAAAGASACITACMGCARQLSAVAEPDQRRFHHVLELVFGRFVDQDAVQAGIEALLAGGEGAE